MSPRALALLAAAVLFPPAILALDLGGLARSLDTTKINKALDTVKDGSKVLKGATGIGPEEERKLGGAVALEVVGKYGGLVRDPEVMRRVNLVGRAVARYSARPDLDWRFGVLDSDTVNAFSTPGGYVFITLGLYQQAANDDVLAGILGHEIAHVTDRHALKIIERNEAAAGLSSQVVKRSNQTREATAKLAQASSVVGFDLGGVLKTLLVNGFDAGTEYVADKDGRAAAVTTGYAPGGLRAALLQLKARGENRKTMFATHPPLDERIKRLPDEAVPVPPAADAPDKPNN